MTVVGSALTVFAMTLAPMFSEPSAVGPKGLKSPPAANLDIHLAEWEKAMAALRSIRCDLKLSRTDPVTGNKREYTGSLLTMKPDKFRLRLERAGDPRDFETFICDGKCLFAYSGLDKVITEQRPGSWLYFELSDNLALGFMSGVLAKRINDRFEVRLFKEDDYYIYLDMRPKRDKDKKNIQKLRVALFGPKTGFAYLPAQIYLVRPNGDAEQWRLAKPTINLKEVDEKAFQFEDLPGFRLHRLPGSKLGATETPEQSSTTEVVLMPACEAIWTMPVVPCGRAGRGFFLTRCGLFRIREAGYKCATAGADPVIGPVSGVQSCAVSVSPSLRSRLASRLGWRNRRGCPRRRLTRSACRPRLPRPIKNSTVT